MTKTPRSSKPKLIGHSHTLLQRQMKIIVHDFVFLADSPLSLLAIQPFPIDGI